MTAARRDGDALDRRGLQDRAVRGAVWTMLHTVISLPLGFVVNLVLARVLDTVGYGRLALLTTVITIAGSVVAIGLTPAMVQFGAKAHAAGRTDEVIRLLRSAQGFRLLVVAPVLTIVVTTVIDVPTPLLLLAILFGIWAPAALEGGPVTLFIENNTAAGARNAMLTNLIVQAGVVTIVLWIGTADAVWATRIMLGVVGTALAVVEMRRVYRRVLLRPGWPTGFPPNFWRFAIPTGAAGLIAQLALQRTEVLYLNWWSTPEAVGLFALAFGLSGHLFAPAQALTGPLIPAISGLREVEPEQVQQALARTLRAAGTVIALLTAAVLPALAILVPTLYGEQFAPAAPAVLAMGLVGAFVMSIEPVTAFVLARLSGRTYLWSGLAALIVNVLVAVATIPFLGLWGAVFANGAAALTQTGVLLRSEQRHLGLSLVVMSRQLLPAALGGLACLAGWSSALAWQGPVLLEASLGAGVALVALVLALRLTGSGLDTGDVQDIVRALPRRLQPLADATLGLLSRRPADRDVH